MPAPMLALSEWLGFAGVAMAAGVIVGVIGGFIGGGVGWQGG
jgi:hypothetical protein